ncbi:carbamoyl-phosphate synthase small subunit, partial [Tenacibaculum discolor]
KKKKKVMITSQKNGIAADVSTLPAKLSTTHKYLVYSSLTGILRHALYSLIFTCHSAEWYGPEHVAHHCDVSYAPNRQAN